MIWHKSNKKFTIGKEVVVCSFTISRVCRPQIYTILLNWGDEIEDFHKGQIWVGSTG